MEDLIITNARIVDGTGAPAYRGDITVNDGVITAVGASSGQARRVIDAEGHLNAARRASDALGDMLVSLGA